jgi:hypothetical protein
MAVVAVQCATMSRLVDTNYIWSDELRACKLTTFVTGTLFWSVPPLTIALFVRSSRWAGSVGCGFYVVAAVAYFYWIDDSYFPYGSMLSGSGEGILRGPFGCLAPLRTWWWRTHTYPMPLPLKIAMFSAGLLVYTTVCFFVAKSCRLRELPGRTL